MLITIKAVKKLAVLSTRGLVWVGWRFFVKAAGIAQGAPNRPPTGEISWAKICVARLADPVISKLLARAPSLSYVCLDGLPPGQIGDFGLINDGGHFYDSLT